MAPTTSSACPPAPLIGHSRAFLRATARIPRLAGCDAGVLILGETGTGKEVCAQAIHSRSARAAGPWVAINCGAIPQELVEDQHGSLLLEEVDALPPAAQAKLPRFLQDQQYRPVGSSAVRQADVRVIAASNRDLDRLVQRGEFRQDLYFRLNLLTLTLPPLRERRDDIAELALHFLAGALRETGRPAGGLTPGALRKLVEHAWPGNVRELHHTIERTVLLGSGPLLQASDIELDGVPGSALSPTASLPPKNASAAPRPGWSSISSATTSSARCRPAPATSPMPLALRARTSGHFSSCCASMTLKRGAFATEQLARPAGRAGRPRPESIYSNVDPIGL